MSAARRRPTKPGRFPRARRALRFVTARTRLPTPQPPPAAWLAPAGQPPRAATARGAVDALHRANPFLPYALLTWTYNGDGARASADFMDARAATLRDAVTRYAAALGAQVLESAPDRGRIAVCTYGTHLGWPIAVEVVVAEVDEGPLRFAAEAADYVQRSDNTVRFAPVVDAP